jgi:ATP-dependent DNA helicase RecG
MQVARDVGRYAIQELDVDGKPVCVVSVARRREGFAQTSGGVVRVRRGTHDDPLFGAELVRFANERTSSRYETTQLGIQIEAAVGGFRREIGRALGWDRATAGRLREAELAVDDRLTVAGALYLLTDPSQALGKAFVEVLRFPDDATVDYHRRTEIRGPVHHVLQHTVDSVADELGNELVVLGARRYELPRLPAVVLREAVANALAHRSYEAAGTCVRVELRPSAVVIRSPGGLPEPVTVENIREASSARNLVVIKVLRALGLAEDAGRGVDVMQDTMANEMLEPPKFLDRGHEARGGAPAPARRGALRGPDRIALVHAARGEVLTNKQLRELLPVDSGEAREILHRLRDEGFLKQRGQRGGATYQLSGTLRPPSGLRLSSEELDKVVLGLAGSGPIANADVRAATGLDRAEARALLDRLVKQQLLRRTGERRGTKYTRA